MGSIQGKLVLVTGASRGIGAATARLMAAKGARVILVARTLKDLEEQAAAIKESGGEAHVYSADLSQHEEVGALVAKVSAELGIPDILVNNAGLGRWLFVHETPPAEAEMMAKLPYLAAFWLTGGFLEGMLQRGSGRIINVNSPASVLPWGGATAYTSSRWAIRGFSESLKIDLRGSGLSVCHCVFGEVSSNYFIDNPGSHERLPKIAKVLPVSTPETVAKWLLLAATSRKKEMTKPFLLWVFRFFLGITPGLVKGLVRATSVKIKT